MEIFKKLDLIQYIPIVLAIALLLSYLYLEWVGMILFFTLFMFFGLLLISYDLLFPIFILVIGLTAQEFEGFQNYISYGLTFVLLSTWILKVYLDKKDIELLNKNILFVILIYLCWNFISALFSEYVLFSLFVSLRTVIFFIIIIIFYNWMNSYKKINLIIDTIILMGIISAGLAVFEFLLSGIIFTQTGLARYGGIFSGVNAFAYLLSFSIPLTLIKIINSTKKNFLSIALLIMLLALFLTFSRSGWLSVLVSSTIILWRYRNFRIFVLSSVLLSVLSFFFITSINEYVMKIFRLNSMLTFRDVLWNAALDMIKDHPVFGVGPANINKYMIPYSKVIPLSWTGNIVKFSSGDAHNLYLTTAVEIGIIGFVIPVLIFILYFKNSFDYYRQVKDNKKVRNIIICSLAIVIGTFCRSFFEGNGIITKGYLSFDIYFWLIFIITLRLPKIRSFI